jgi:hypothetical protein
MTVPNIVPTDTENVVFLLTTSGASGHWAKGESLHRAAYNLLKAGAKKSAIVTCWIVFNDADAFINEWGAPRYGGSEAPNAWLLPAFRTGTLGATLSSNADYI